MNLLVLCCADPFLLLLHPIQTRQFPPITQLFGIISPVKTSIFIPLSLLSISVKSTFLPESPAFPQSFSSRECTRESNGTPASLKIDFKMYVVSSGDVIQTHGQMLRAAKSLPVLRN